MKYIVRFLWNNDGQSDIDHVISAVLPDGCGPRWANEGFWCTVVDPWKSPTAVVDFDKGTVWIPPGRITAVIKAPE